jgi:hypothetical protein
MTDLRPLFEPTTEPMPVFDHRPVLSLPLVTVEMEHGTVKYADFCRTCHAGHACPTAARELGLTD